MWLRRMPWIWMGLLAGSLSAARAAETPGRIESVTVYRGQALVTRSVTLGGEAGAREVVVTELPARILGASLFASGDDGVSVRAVQYRTRAVAEEPEAEVRELMAQIEEVQRNIRRLQAEAQMLAKLEGFVANMESFSAAKAREDLARGALNAEAVTAVTNMVFQKRTELAERTFDLNESLRQAQHEQQLLQRKRQELASKFTRTVREAVIYIDKPKAGPGRLSLNYLVGGASWSPTYNLRAVRAGKEVSLEYSALVQQASGEDWQDVKLTLSTASPAMAAEAPILTPLWVALARGQAAQGPSSPSRVIREQREFNTKLNDALAQRQSGVGNSANLANQQSAPSLATTSQTFGEVRFSQDWAANTFANRLQIMDLNADKDVLQAAQRLTPTDEVLSVNYPLKGPISLPSRQDQQMIQIASLKLPASFYYQATPVLTPYVYQQAEVTNSSELALLAGPIHSYMSGQFMGVGRLPLVAKGQRFIVGFGVDSQLRVNRELAEKTDRVVGGNRELTFAYRLLVDNYKNQPADVRILDRLPEPENSEIRVTLLDTSQPLSDDAVYQRTLQKDGILQWEIDVPARRSGAEAKVIEYRYKVEFDRSLELAEPTPEKMQQKRMDFQQKVQGMFRAK